MYLENKLRYKNQDKAYRVHLNVRKSANLIDRIILAPWTNIKSNKWQNSKRFIKKNNFVKLSIDSINNFVKLSID